jgi:hypothetical protein
MNSSQLRADAYTNEYDAYCLLEKFIGFVWIRSVIFLL